MNYELIKFKSRATYIIENPNTKPNVGTNYKTNWMKYFFYISSNGPGLKMGNML